MTALNPDALDATVGFQGDTPSFENDWNGLAAFLLGTPDVSGKSSQFIKMNSFENQYAFYVRDRWRWTEKLTIDLGLRWELYPNRWRSGGLGIESYDPTTNEALIGGRGSIPQDNGVGFSKKLFAPRLGLAYRLNEKTVIRTGYGITYHSHPWGAQALRGWYPLTLVAVFSGVNGFQPVTTDRAYVAAGIPNAPLGPNVGIPSICCPDISTGRVPLPSVAETGYPRADAELHRGYIQSWNLIGERTLPGEIIASIGYVGSASVRGFAFLDINASQIPGSGDEGRPLFAEFGRTTTTREWDGRTHSVYHALQATLNRRFKDGLLLKSAYTWSKAIDEAPYSDWTEFRYNAASVFYRNRSLADHDIPHNFQLGALYELPFGKQKKWATSGLSSTIFGGWQLNGVFAAYSGRPFNLTASGSSLNMLAVSPAQKKRPEHTEIAKLLIAKGAPGKDDALNGAIESGDAALVKFILDSGGIAAPKLSEALEAAQSRKKTEIASMLEKAGAKVPEEFRIDAAQLERFAGRYKNAGGNELVVVVNGARLAIGPAAAPLDQRAALAAEDATTFRAIGMGGMSIVFKIEADKVTGFTLM